MFAALAFGSVVAIALYLVLQIVATSVIDNVYLSEENKEAREQYYVESLQEYITENELTDDDNVAFAKWAQSNRYIYLMVYNGDQLFFDSSMYEELLKPPTPPTSEEDKPDTDDTTGEGENDNTTGNPDVKDDDTTPGVSPNPDGTNTPGGDATGDGEGEDTPIGPDGEGDTDTEGGSDGNTQNGDTEGDENNSTIGGITVRFPTREELKKYAEENDAHVINTANDKMLVVNMADFTEYIYYDIINITSLVAALVALFVVIMIHFHGVTSRITKLAGDVSDVARGDMEHEIHSRGRDEISELALNVDDMRTSILENIEKERAIMDANAELITSMSHDIRTPLTVLLGYLEIMKERVGDDVTMAEYVNASEKTALRLKKLSDDLFNYFLLFGAGATSPKLEEYDIGTLFDQMLSEHVLLLRDNGYQVSFDMPTGAAARRILTDPAELMRVFENLFSNVMKYADKARPVSIVSRLDDGKLILSFTNGIAKTHFAESNGIGLRTCHKIAEMLSVSFDTTDDGDTFVARLEFDTLEEE